MKKIALTLTAATLVLGSMALSATAQTQAPGAASVNGLRNATPIVTKAECRGRGPHCDPGFVYRCGRTGCHCYPC